MDRRRNDQTLGKFASGHAVYMEISEHYPICLGVMGLKTQVKSVRQRFFENFNPDCIMISI